MLATPKIQKSRWVAHKIGNCIYTTFGGLFTFLFKVLRLHVLNVFWQLWSLKNFCWSEWKPRISSKSQFPELYLLTKTIKWNFDFGEVQEDFDTNVSLDKITHQNCEEFTKLENLTEDKSLGWKAGISYCSLWLLWLGCLYWSMGLLGSNNVFQWISNEDQNSHLV